MRNFFRGNNSQRGAVSASYVIGLVLIAAVLIGGVALLKNMGGKSDTDEPQVSETSTIESSDDATDSSVTQNQVASTGASGEHVPQTGAGGEYVPDTITATGPGDFMAGTVGLVLVGATIYMGWNYMQSRRAVAAALLRK